jgi:vanillate O-demethylase ferredoxin subunit
MKSRFLSFLTWSHRWIGLTIGLIMVFLAVTGAGQAFREQLEPVVYSDLRAAPICDRLPLDRLVAVAAESHPGADADSIRFHPGGDETDAVRFRDRRTVYVNPCSGSATGEQGTFAGFFGTLEYVHRMMFFSDFRLWSGTVTLIALVFLVIGGIVLWWPRSWREAKRGLKLDKRLTGMAFMLNLHKTVGVYVWVVLLVVTFSGTAMAFDWVKQGVYWAVGSEVPMTGRPGPPRDEGKRVTAVDAETVPSLEDLWQKAAPMLDNPRDVTIRLPRRPGDPLQISAIEASAPHPRARSELVLDGTTGEVWRFTPYSKTSLGNKVYNWGVAIHTGQAGGWLGALMVFVAALAVPVLAYSGVMSWWRRRRSRKALGRV